MADKTAAAWEVNKKYDIILIVTSMLHCYLSQAHFM
jgi:hypothetical protein